MTEKKIRTRKAVIIGAGRVGSHSALCLMFQHLVNEIVFLDVNEEAARAQALDLEDLASGLGDSFKICVGDYSDCADAHFVILTGPQPPPWRDPPADAGRHHHRCLTASSGRSGVRLPRYPD